MSLIMADTLVNCLTEQQVFQKYVIDTPTEKRDEYVFFAARDAARYAAGHLKVEELLSDIGTCPIGEADADGICADDAVAQVPLRELRNILGTLADLEKRVGELCGINVPSRISVSSGNDLMEVKDVLEYIGCGATTLRRWIKKGQLPHPYRRGLCSYYSKSELDANRMVQKYLNQK